MLNLFSQILDTINFDICHLLGYRLLLHTTVIKEWNKFVSFESRMQYKSYDNNTTSSTVHTYSYTEVSWEVITMQQLKTTTKPVSDESSLHGSLTELCSWTQFALTTETIWSSIDNEVIAVNWAITSMSNVIVAANHRFHAEFAVIHLH